MKKRTPRLKRHIAALLLAVHLTGCHGWHPTTISPAQLIAEENPSTVRVTLTDGRQLTLVDPTIRNDSIVFEIGRVTAGVVLSDVSTVEVRRFNADKTIGLILAVPVGLVVYFATVCAECFRGY